MIKIPLFPYSVTINVCSCRALHSLKSVHDEKMYVRPWIQPWTTAVTIRVGCISDVDSCTYTEKGSRVAGAK